MRKSSLSFSPTVEIMEGRRLLATINKDITNFDGNDNLVLDNADVTGNTAWGFPGIKLSLYVNCPSTHMGFRKVTYQFDVNNFIPEQTVYTVTEGKYKLRSGVINSWTGSLPQQDFHDFALGKFVGTVTISIEAEAQRSYPQNNIFDTIKDSIVIKSEAPTVNFFTIAGENSVNDPAPIVDFGPISVVGGIPTPNPQGTFIGFLMGQGNPLTRKHATFWADVTNNTHYDIDMGFIQVVDFSAFASFTGGSTISASGINDLDVKEGAQEFWYNGSGYIPKGATAQLKTEDSPALYTSAHSQVRGFLQTISYNFSAKTHLAMAGARKPSGGPQVAGYPIALSTAAWHINGSAIHLANQTNPGAATEAGTLNVNNWTISELNSGSGSEAPTPPTNSPWFAPGDNVIKYLEWEGNTYTSKESFVNAQLRSVSQSYLLFEIDYRNDSQTQVLGNSKIPVIDRLMQLDSIAIASLNGPEPLSESIFWNWNLYHWDNVLELFSGRHSMSLLLNLRSNRLFRL